MHNITRQGFMRAGGAFAFAPFAGTLFAADENGQQGLTPQTTGSGATIVRTTGSDPSDNTLTEKPGTCRFATSIAAQIE